MHEPVGQLAIVGEKEEPGRIDVQSPDRNPSVPTERWKAIEHGRSRLRVTARGHFAGRLVIANEPVPGIGPSNQPAVDAHRVAGRRPMSQTRGPSVDRDPARGDPALGFAPRREAGIG